METADLKNKLVAVLGYGLEGKTVTGYLLRHGLKPVLFDQRPWQNWGAEEQKGIKALGLRFIFGPDCFKELAGFDIAFRSPGIPLSHPDIRLRIKNKGLKIILTSQTQWFFEHCRANIIGITGTKGKGTTASLIWEILKTNSQFPISNFQIKPKTLNPESKIYLTGNIGKTQPLDILDKLTGSDWVVYELSSFQLQTLKQSPQIAVVLMVTSEHLDYHESVQEYINAKATITKYQTQKDFAVINADFPTSIKIGEPSRGQKYYFSRRQELANGCFIKDEQIVIKNVLGQNFQFPVSSIHLRGRHNLENICAATAAGVLAGASEASIRQAIADFKGLEHRLQLVAEKNGIKFYDDSFSTTPETAMAGIGSFTEPEIVILGGSTKNSDFAKLGEIVARSKNIKRVILIGREAFRIKRAILEHLPSEPGKFFLEGAKNMAEVFAQIKTAAKPGDVVLLSPACASFDMFENYEQRGLQFKQKADRF